MYGTWIQFVVYPRRMLTTCHGKWGTVSSKFQQCLEGLRGKVCNGEVLRRIPTACKWGRACWLTSTHTQMDDVSRESHAHWSEAPFPASSERKWHWTRRGREGEGVNHRNNAALHHRFLGLPDHPGCRRRPHSAPFSPVWLSLRWLVHTEFTLRRRRSSSGTTCLWRFSERHMKAGDPWRWFKWAPVGREFGLTLAVEHQICMRGKVLFVLFHACPFDTAPLREPLYFCKGPHVVSRPCTVFTHSVGDMPVCVPVYWLAYICVRRCMWRAGSGEGERVWAFFSLGLRFHRQLQTGS